MDLGTFEKTELLDVYQDNRQRNILTEYYGWWSYHCVEDTVKFIIFQIIHQILGLRLDLYDKAHVIIILVRICLRKIGDAFSFDGDESALIHIWWTMQQ